MVYIEEQYKYKGTRASYPHLSIWDSEENKIMTMLTVLQKEFLKNNNNNRWFCVAVLLQHFCNGNLVIHMSMRHVLRNFSCPSGLFSCG